MVRRGFNEGGVLTRCLFCSLQAEEGKILQIPEEEMKWAEDPHPGGSVRRQLVVHAPAEKPGQEYTASRRNREVSLPPAIHRCTDSSKYTPHFI